MRVESVTVTYDWLKEQRRINVWRTLEDQLGNHHVRYQEHVFTPYNNKAELVPALEKGSVIDRMI